MVLICESCKNEIAHKPIEKYGKYFCCVHCLGAWEVETNRMKIDRSKLDPKQMKWVTEGCAICPNEIRTLCREERKGGAFIIKLAKYFMMPWCCHAQHNLSCTLTDATVSMKTVTDVLATAEKIAKQFDHVGVTPADLQYAYAELAKKYEYVKPEKVTVWTELPQAKPINHLIACMVCDSEWRSQCIPQWDKPWEIFIKIKGQTEVPWCSHAMLSVAAMLDSGRFKEENLKKLFNFVEKIATEKNYSAVTYRIFYIALGRACEEKIK